MWLEDTWIIGDYEFFCTLEWFEGSTDKTNEYWTSKGRMRRGQAPTGYHITIRISPPNEYLSRQILGLLRKARPFRGPPVSQSFKKRIESFWATGMLEQEDKIFEDVRKVLERELSVAQKKANKEKILDEGEISSGGGYGWQKSYEDKRFSKYDPPTYKDDDVLFVPDKGKKNKARKKSRRAKSRRLAPKIAISCVAVIIAAVFVLGNGEISLPNISLPNISLSDITGCKTIDSEIINPGPNQDKISLKLCEEYITVSGDLHKNTLVTLKLHNPDGKSFPTWKSAPFEDKIDWEIPREMVEKDRGTWKITLYVNGKYMQNQSLDIVVVKP